MSIRIDETIRKDAQGFPVVSWIEDRNMFASGALEKVTCVIRPNREGVLEFVAFGKVRFGDEEEALPWDQLEGFDVSEGEALYRTPEWAALIKAATEKSRIAAALLRDGAAVIMARFKPRAESQPHYMHLNCASATLAEVHHLVARLDREFIGQRRRLVADRDCEDFVWQEASNGKFVAYVPVPLARLPWYLAALANASVLAILTACVFAFYYFVIR
jgi:hypothetical protein